MHPNARNLAGMKTGRLSVVECVGRRKDKHLAWLCVCECGREKIVASNSLTRRNPVQSCGCMNKTTAQVKKRALGAWNDGKSYSIGSGLHCYRTRHAWAKAAIRHYGNRCERCSWDKARCDAHHRTPKASGGLHTIENAIILCPNCHRIEHERYLS